MAITGYHYWFEWRFMAILEDDIETSLARTAYCSAAQEVAIGNSRQYMRSLHADWQRLLLTLALSFLTSCGPGPSPVSVATPAPSSSSAATATSPSSQTPSGTATLPSSTPLPTLANDALGLCTPVIAGTLTGKLTQAGKPVPDGTYLGVDFAGGPFVNTQAKNGQYSIPLLARKCPDGLHWVGFLLRLDHESYPIQPTSAQTHRDIDLPSTAEPFVSSLPACSVVIGEVRGKLLVGGHPAPDGAAVLAARMGKGTSYPNADPDKDQMTQRAFGTQGQYSLASIGTRCEDGRVSFMPMTLFAPGVSTLITPTQEITIQDISVP